MVNSDRVQVLKDIEKKGNVILYWMSRDQRMHDNWALLYAQQLARSKNISLWVVFTLANHFPGATHRVYDFMLKGLQHVEKSLDVMGIPFILLKGDPHIELIKFCNEFQVSTIVTDFDPLHVKQLWKEQLRITFDGTFVEVDAHNVIPCRVTSDKEEYAAYTIRPKIKRLLNNYLIPYPDIIKQVESLPYNFSTDWCAIESSISFDRSVGPVDWIEPGENAAHKMLSDFLDQRLELYDAQRNNPLLQVQSNLSPYLHFGHISAQRVVLDIMERQLSGELTDSFIEQVVVRKELSDNYCFYNTNYDTFDGFRSWAKQTLEEHSRDERENIYTPGQFEKAQTHDLLWNACQTDLANTGKLHGYLRMYWAKKILEWSVHPAVAMETAVYLNDKYELDGRDPNGYVGCAWSIGGVHDRPWFERPVFGKIRFMNLSGARRKFDVNGYISAVNQSRWIK